MPCSWRPPLPAPMAIPVAISGTSADATKPAVATIATVATTAMMASLVDWSWLFHQFSCDGYEVAAVADSVVPFAGSLAGGVHVPERVVQHVDVYVEALRVG